MNDPGSQGGGGDKANSSCTLKPSAMCVKITRIKDRRVLERLAVS